MFERLKALYQSGKIDKDALNNAVAKGWITAKESEAIQESD